MKNNELSKNPAAFDQKIMGEAHNKVEMERTFGLPVAGAVVGKIGSVRVTNAIFNSPANPDKFATLSRPQQIGLGAVYLAALASGQLIGKDIGDALSRGVYANSVRKHFYDEAEPAMRRLMKG